MRQRSSSSSSAAILCVLMPLLLGACAVAPAVKAPPEVPVGLPAAVAPEPAPSCQWSEEEASAWSRAWVELKRAQVEHPAGWMLREEEVLQAAELGARPEDRAALERLYVNRMGTPVFVINGQLGSRSEELQGVLQHPELQGDPILQAASERLESWGALEAALEAAVERPLEEADLRRLCGASAFSVDPLPRTTLAQLSELDALIAQARQVGGQLDAALVVAMWHTTDKLQRSMAALPKLQRPKGLEAARHAIIDAELLSRAVWAVLRYDSDRRPFEEVGPLIRRAVVAAQLGDIDPFVLVTLIFMESRFRPDAIGDGGMACGMAQQHAEYSMFWEGVSDALQQHAEVRIPEERTRRQRRYECDRLKDPEYALKALVFNLNIIKVRAPDLSQSVCRYNEGPYAPCKGRGLHYLKQHQWWRGTIQLTYQRLQEQLERGEEAPEAPGQADDQRALSDSR